MLRRHILPLGFSLTLFLMLMLNAADAAEAARAALTVCAKTLIPSLFPFFVLIIHYQHYL